MGVFEMAVVVIFQGVLLGFIVMLTYQREKALERAEEAEKQAQDLKNASIKLINDLTTGVEDQRTFHKYYKNTVVGDELEDAIMHALIQDEFNQEE